MEPSIEGPQLLEAPEKQIVFEIDLVPTEGTRLPIVRSGNFGRSLFFGQLSGKQCA
jgi:hypothetical protein